MMNVYVYVHKYKDEHVNTHTDKEIEYMSIATNE